MSVILTKKSQKTEDFSYNAMTNEGFTIFPQSGGIMITEIVIGVFTKENLLFTVVFLI